MVNMLGYICEVFVIVIVCTSVCCQKQESAFLELSLVSYTKCQTDRECKAKSNNSFCFNNDAGVIGECKCLESYEMVSRNRTSFTCLGPAGYGEPCEKNRQCQLMLTENAECSSGTCQCKKGNHLYSDGRCYLSVLLNDFCRSDGNCWLSDGTFGNCVSGRCICKFDKQVPTADKTGCLDARELGELCDNDNQCSVVPNAICRVNCKCATGYILSRDQKTCLEAATAFYEMCEENDQCSAFLRGSICHNGTCTCQDGQHGVGSQCVKNRLLGDGCLQHEDCVSDPKYSGSITCVDASCKCAPGVVNESIGCDSCVFYSNFMILILSVFCTVLRL